MELEEALPLLQLKRVHFFYAIRPEDDDGIVDVGLPTVTLVNHDHDPSLWGPNCIVLRASALHGVSCDYALKVCYDQVFEDRASALIPAVALGGLAHAIADSFNAQLFLLDCNVRFNRGEICDVIDREGKKLYEFTRFPVEMGVWENYMRSTPETLREAVEQGQHQPYAIWRKGHLDRSVLTRKDGPVYVAID